MAWNRSHHCATIIPDPSPEIFSTCKTETSYSINNNFLLPTPLRQPAFCFLSLWIWEFDYCSYTLVGEVIQYLSFSDRHISLSKISSWFIPVVTRVRIFFFPTGISIWFGRLQRARWPRWSGWASSNPWSAWTQQKAEEGEIHPFCPCLAIWAGTCYLIFYGD